MKTPEDKKIVFMFMSVPERDPALRWQAWVSFPPGATAETPLAITVVDGLGQKVEDAVFEIAGKSLPVVGGEATMTFGEFVAGKHSVPLRLCRKGQKPLPGVLTFG